MSAHELTLDDAWEPELIDLDEDDPEDFVAETISDDDGLITLDDPADFEDGAFDGETIAFEEITLED